MAFYFGVFNVEEARGGLRSLQFLFAINAFVYVFIGGSSLTIQSIEKNLTITASWSFPFNLYESQAVLFNGSESRVKPLNSNNKASAEFFAFTSTMAIIICTACFVVYIFFDRLYRSNPSIASCELIITLIWVCFWLAGSSAWTQAVTNIRLATSTENVVQLFEYNNGNSDWNTISSPNHRRLSVSLMYGFLSFIFWLASVWPVYKETSFFKSKTSPQNQSSNIAGSTFPNPTQLSQNNPMF